jgi:hypothetical protein
LSFSWSMDFILNIPCSLSNIHISWVHTICVLLWPHSGWYFLDPSINLWISWSHCF